MKKKCSICKKNETDIHVVIDQVDSRVSYHEDIYVCEECLEESKENFIFYCVTCQKSYKKDKKSTIRKLTNSSDYDNEVLAEGLSIISKEQTVMGISSCIACDKETIIENYMNNSKNFGTA